MSTGEYSTCEGDVLNLYRVRPTGLLIAIGWPKRDNDQTQNNQPNNHPASPHCRPRSSHRFYRQHQEHRYSGPKRLLSLADMNDIDLAEDLILGAIDAKQPGLENPRRKCRSITRVSYCARRRISISLCLLLCLYRPTGRQLGHRVLRRTHLLRVWRTRRLRLGAVASLCI